jgi:Ras-related GTP-binding protein C/D
LFEVYSKLCIATDELPYEAKNFAICSEMIDVFIDISCIYGHIQESGPADYSESMIKLTNGTILLLKEVEKFLVIIMMLREENYDRPHLLNFNVDIFRKGKNCQLTLKLILLK